MDKYEQLVSDIKDICNELYAQSVMVVVTSPDKNAALSTMLENYAKAVDKIEKKVGLQDD